MAFDATGKHIHFLGIGGIGVSALAQLAVARGYTVSGSDLHTSPDGNPAIQRLLELGVTIYAGHRAENLDDTVSLVVATAAIGKDNPEIAEAHHRCGIRVVSRADYLGELMNEHTGPKIAVSGTHGKTTTTGMIGVMLMLAGTDPTVFVGGEIDQLGGNVRIGSKTGPFVAEACEAYDSFLSLKPDIAVVTNIEADHLDHYGDFAGVLTAFNRFIGGVSGSGSIIVCGDDEGAKGLLSTSSDAYTRNWVTYGVENGVVGATSLTGIDEIALGKNPGFTLVDKQGRHRVDLRVPGKHNVQNAIAAAAVGSLLGVPTAAIAKGLSQFSGATRRQEILGEVRVPGGSILIMDDYAHHPTEIEATISALRAAYPDRRLTVVFQPHLYSRTRDFLPEFARSLALADALIVTGIYAAREEPIPGVFASEIARLAGEKNPELSALYVKNRQDVPLTLIALSNPGDLTLFMGAGDIREQGVQFVELVKRKSAIS